MTRRRGRLLALLAVAVVLLTGLPMTGAAALGDRTSRLGDVRLTVSGMSPTVPAQSSGRRRLAIRVTLQNTTDAALDNVQVLAQRGYPIGSQQELDMSMGRSASRPIDTSVPIAVPATRAVRASLPAGARTTATFRTTTSVSQGPGLCLCANAVYPLYLTAQDGAGNVLGSTRTYVPSFDAAHRRLPVSWVWPLIDRPHRLADRTEFIGSDLTALVDGGRLDAALQVLEDVGPAVPVTVVLDPELLDELEVMAQDRYRILSSSGRVTAGTGRTAAQDWLSRLSDVLRNDDVSIDLTPYGDPDVQTLSRRGQSWNAGMPQDMRANVRAALAGRPIHRDIAWPAGGAVSRRTLDRLADTGTRTVVLRNESLAPSTADGIPISLTRLPTRTHPVRAALTSGAIERAAASAVSSGGAGFASLPTVLAELAVRVDQSPSTVDAAVITPPRYVDPNPSVAAQVIRSTSRSTFTTPAALRVLVRSDAVAAGHSALRRVPSSADRLPSGILSPLRAVRRQLPAVRSLLARSNAAAGLLRALPEAAQRITSAAFRPHTGTVQGTSAGLVLSHRLVRTVRGLVSGVRIVKPASGSYTLASNHASLPITVDNRLAYVVAVRVKVTPQSGLPGLYSPRTATKLVQPGSKQQLKVPTVLQRSGRIGVQAQLETPNGAPLGRAVTLSVHSTALGEIGVIITVVAGVVLALAVLLRYVRRIQRIRRKRAKAASAASRPAKRAPETPVSERT